MTEYAPLSQACVRALQDKMNDKRKIAASEIEKMVRQFASTNNTAQIKRVLKVLGQDFATSHNPNVRRGGLIGLASVGIALGKDSSNYTADLVNPILSCFSDTDPRVRYFACEALYNVIKVARGSILVHFTGIFNALSKLSTDPDQGIKSCSEHLDRAMKDIVTESTSFDMNEFMPLLRERILTKNSFGRQFIVSWISALDAVPDINLIQYLPELLDGLFLMLQDPMVEVKKTTETVLGEFLRRIKCDPNCVDFSAMINILILHAQTNDDLVQFTAISWIKEFVQLSGALMLPYMAGIFSAVLPCLSYDTDARRMTDIKETATAVNFTLMKLIAIQVDGESIELKNDEVKEHIGDVDDSIERTEMSGELNLSSVVDSLTQHLVNSTVQTKVAVLRWIHHLFTKVPKKMFHHISNLFPALLRTLSDPADEVVQQCLIVLAEIISIPTESIPEQLLLSENQDIQKASLDGMSPYYYKFVVSLLKLFSADRNLLEDRGSFIIRQLCVLLNAEDIFRILAKILLVESNLKFASLMVETLSMILLTSSELFELRMKLKELKTAESCALFCCLYETWCHSPVATLALCLLAQSYSHVCDLVRNFSTLDITVEFLTEIDKLIQLIESPIFAYLRLELLEVPNNRELVRALYGLLMLLPQSEAFSLLRNRLSCIPSPQFFCDNKTAEPRRNAMPKTENVDYKKLLDHFVRVQENHKVYKQGQRLRSITEKEFGAEIGTS